MIKSYDQQLIADAQKYFKKLYGREIKAEEAESFLLSLLEFYNSFSQE